MPLSDDRYQVIDSDEDDSISGGVVSGATVLRGRRVAGFAVAARRVTVRLAAGFAAVVRRVVVFRAVAVVRRVAAGLAAALRAVVLRAVVAVLRAVAGLRAAAARVVLRPVVVREAAARPVAVRVVALRVAGFAVFRAAVVRVAVLRPTGFLAAAARFGAALRAVVAFLAVERLAVVALRAPAALVPAARVPVALVLDRAAVFRVPARIAIGWARGRSVVVSSLFTVENSLFMPLPGNSIPMRQGPCVDGTAFPAAGSKFAHMPRQRRACERLSIGLATGSAPPRYPSATRRQDCGDRPTCPARNIWRSTPHRRMYPGKG